MDNPEGAERLVINKLRTVTLMKKSNNLHISLPPKIHNTTLSPRSEKEKPIKKQFYPSLIEYFLFLHSKIRSLGKSFLINKQKLDNNSLQYIKIANLIIHRTQQLCKELVFFILSETINRKSKKMI